MNHSWYHFLIQYCWWRLSRRKSFIISRKVWHSLSKTPNWAHRQVSKFDSYRKFIYLSNQVLILSFPAVVVCTIGFVSHSQFNIMYKTACPTELVRTKSGWSIFISASYNRRTFKSGQNILLMAMLYRTYKQSSRRREFYIC